MEVQKIKKYEMAGLIMTITAYIITMVIVFTGIIYGIIKGFEFTGRETLIFTLCSFLLGIAICLDMCTLCRIKKEAQVNENT
jgi:hypothetical protein